MTGLATVSPSLVPTSLQKSFFKLTAGKTEFMQATKSGHNVQMIEPDLIVDAVKWVMGHL